MPGKKVPRAAPPRKAVLPQLQPLYEQCVRVFGENHLYRKLSVVTGLSEVGVKRWFDQDAIPVIFRDLVHVLEYTPVDHWPRHYLQGIEMYDPYYYASHLAPQIGSQNV